MASISLAAGFLLAVSGGVLEAQASGPVRSSWTVGLAGGVFKYEPSADNTFPMIAVRLDRPISKWVRFEVGTTYTRPEIQTDGQGFFDPSLPAEHTNLFTVTLGAQARWSRMAAFQPGSSAGTTGVPRTVASGVRPSSSPSVSGFGPPITSECVASTGSAKTLTRRRHAPTANLLPGCFGRFEAAPKAVVLHHPKR